MLGAAAGVAGAVEGGAMPSSLRVRAMMSLPNEVSPIDPTRTGFEFVKTERNGKRALIIRDGQHEYFFTEASLAATSRDSLRSN